eukprot:snap_masked-scaffold_19-processed-gene-2.17-mRNA-1 protein AED:1.00 eAED:1.00 QI:0/0/0/0/1/1/2/0/228
MNIYFDRRFLFYLKSTYNELYISDKKCGDINKGKFELSKLDDSSEFFVQLDIYKLRMNRYSLAKLKKQLQKLDVKHIKISFMFTENLFNAKNMSNCLESIIGACGKIKLELSCRKSYANGILKQLQRYENITQLNLEEFYYDDNYLISLGTYFFKTGSKIETLSIGSSNAFLPLCKTLVEKPRAIYLKEVVITFTIRESSFSQVATLNAMRLTYLVNAFFISLFIKSI